MNVLDQQFQLIAPRGFNPVWSPDGQRIAYSGEVGETSDIYTVLPGDEPVSLRNRDDAYLSIPDLAAGWTAYRLFRGAS